MHGMLIPAPVETMTGLRFSFSMQVSLFLSFDRFGADATEPIWVIKRNHWSN